MKFFSHWRADVARGKKPPKDIKPDEYEARAIIEEDRRVRATEQLERREW